MIRLIITIVCMMLAIISSYSKDYNIIDFGAHRSHTKVSTKSIQAAIDAASADGGGRVIIPEGVVQYT